jgi:hypothetical protein
MTAAPPPLPWRIRAEPEVILLLCSGVALILGAVWLAATAAGWTGPGCAWRACTALPCAGCGTTRSWQLLAAGRWSEALRMNPAAALLPPGLAAANLYAAAVVLLRLEPWRPAPLARLPWRWIFALLLLANWTYLLATGRV